MMKRVLRVSVLLLGLASMWALAVVGGAASQLGPGPFTPNCNGLSCTSKSDCGGLCFCHNPANITSGGQCVANN